MLLVLLNDSHSGENQVRILLVVESEVSNFI